MPPLPRRGPAPKGLFMALIIEETDEKGKRNFAALRGIRECGMIVARNSKRSTE